MTTTLTAYKMVKIRHNIAYDVYEIIDWFSRSIMGDGFHLFAKNPTGATLYWP